MILGAIHHDAASGTDYTELYLGGAVTLRAYLLRSPRRVRLELRDEIGEVVHAVGWPLRQGTLLKVAGSILDDDEVTYMDGPLKMTIGRHLNFRRSGTTVTVDLTTASRDDLKIFMREIVAWLFAAYVPPAREN